MNIDKLFYRGLRICDATFVAKSKDQLCNDSDIVSLEKRRNVHLLLFMYRQSNKLELLKQTNVRTRLHTAPVFNTYNPIMKKRVKMYFMKVL